MKIKVLYHSATGNTKKVAEAITSGVGVTAEEIKENYTISESIDLLFIGDGVYFGKMSQKTKTFINNLDNSLVKQMIVFGTYGRQAEAITSIEALLKDKKIPVVTEHFVCKGQAWFIVSRKHPNEEDLNKAVQFGKDIVESIKKSDEGLERLIFSN